MGHGALRNPMHPPISGDEHHIQRCDGIAHPHGAFAWGAPIEQHPLIWLYFRAEHQADHLLFGLNGHFHGEGKAPAIAGFKHQGLGRQTGLRPIHTRLRQGRKGQQGAKRQQGTSLHESLHDTSKHFQAKWNHLATRKMQPENSLEHICRAQAWRKCSIGKSLKRGCRRTADYGAHHAGAWRISKCGEPMVGRVASSGAVVA